MENRIPKGWRTTTLDSISTRVKRKNSVDCRTVLTISSLLGLVDQTEYFNKKVASKNTSHYTLLFNGEYAYNKSYSDGFPVGAVRKLTRYKQGVLSPLYICFKLNQGPVSPKYIEYFFDGQWFVKEITFIAKEGARNHGLLNIGIQDFFNILVLLPPLAEQEKIASILSSVDDAIQAREAVLAQTKVVKKGLLQDLLTKGIGHTEFKDSKLGRIPKSWEVKRFYEVVEIQSGQVDPKVEPYRTYPLVAPNHLESHTGRIIKFESAQVQRAISGKYLFQKGDVVYSKIRPYLVKMWLADRVGLCSADMYPLRVKNDFNNVFLLNILLSNRFTEYVNTLSARTGIPKVNREELGSFYFQVPPLAEQQKIAEILTSVDNQIQAHESAIEQLKQTKVGLLQDLLTGKVRVKV